MVAPAHIRRVAPAAGHAEASIRLYQGLYGCTMHPAGLLHSIAAILNAEAEGTMTLASVARAVTVRAEQALSYAEPADAWRYEAMIALCQRLATTSPS
jgi:hypothetical protein